MVEVRREIQPPWPYRLPGPGRDGVARRRGGVLERVLHVGGQPVVVRAAQPAPQRVVVGAWAADPEAAIEALGRWRAALGVDLDLRRFADRFRWDPLIGRSVRERPHLRCGRRPEPFEALAWAITEQLIEVERAHAIQRRVVRALGREAPWGWGEERPPGDGEGGTPHGGVARPGRPGHRAAPADPGHLGRRSPGGAWPRRDAPLRDAPSAEQVAGVAPARLCAWGLAEQRAITLRRAAAVVARRGVDLAALRAIGGVGTWTLEMTALHGLGRLDVVPAGDLGLLKLVGRLTTGDPEAVAEEAQVRELFEPYGAWKALAAAHAMGSGPSALAVPVAAA